MPAPLPIVAVVGPTAAGKSELALDLAEALGGEVVNTDSMQLYRGMDIGTAKLPPEQRRGIAHHLLDVLDVQEAATVAEFQSWARAAIASCRARGVVPVLVGGSALYTRAVVDRFEFPGTDPSLRSRLEEELAAVGAGELHRRLAERDPAAAARILPGNGRRVVRALEVVELTGRPFSATLPAREYVDPATVQLGVDCPRAAVDDRVTRRVARMWADGLVQEVRDLERQGLREGRTASRALGYQQVLELFAGARSEPDAQAATVTGTRRFARKQDTWFRKDPRIRWVGYDDPDRVATAVAAVRSAVDAATSSAAVRR